MGKMNTALCSFLSNTIRFADFLTAFFFREEKSFGLLIYRRHPNNIPKQKVQILKIFGILKCTWVVVRL